MKRTFTVALHEDYGTLGFRPDWIPNADPLTGMAVPHDILEHGARDDGSTESELMALGAAMYVRGDGTDYFRNAGEAYNISADFPTIWQYHRDRDNRDRISPTRTRMDADLRQRVQSIIVRAKDLFRSEYHYESADSLPTTEDWANMGRWLAKGYHKAVRRYRGVIGGRHGINSLFRQIEECATEALKHADEYMVLTVRVNIKRSMAWVDCDYPVDSYA